jgi:hypothetical protein
LMRTCENFSFMNPYARISEVGEGARGFPMTLQVIGVSCCLAEQLRRPRRFGY